MVLVLEQRYRYQKKKRKRKNKQRNLENKYKEYHCKPAFIHTVAVVSRRRWNHVKQQNERADTVERAAAKENEASVRYIQMHLLRCRAH